MASPRTAKLQLRQCVAGGEAGASRYIRTLPKFAVVAVVGLLGLGGCASVVPRPDATDLTHRVFQLAGDGRLSTHLEGVGVLKKHKGPNGEKVDQRLHYRTESDAPTAALYIQQAFDELRARPVPPRHVLLFAHGGLKSFKAGLKKAVELEEYAGLGLGRPRADTAFLYLNWDAGLLSTYGEHLITGQGQVQPMHRLGSKLAGLGLGVVTFGVDVARGVVCFPRNLIQYATEPGLLRISTTPASTFYQLGNAPARSGDRPPRGGQVGEVNRFSGELRTAFERDTTNTLRIGLGPSKRKGAFFYHGFLTAFWNVFPIPCTWVPIRPAVIVFGEAVGRPAWRAMLRRNQTMFHRPIAAGLPTPDVSAGTKADRVARKARRAAAKPQKIRESQRYLTTPGVLPQLADSLEAYRRWRDRRTQRDSARLAGLPDSRAPLIVVPDKSQATLTLLGHSMGAIPFSQLLLECKKRIYCRNIVFMAAACDIGDFRHKVVPYLQEHPDTRFYNLTLHPYAELTENMASGYLPKWLFPLRLLPDGSLLVMIDRLLTTPLTVQERTLGRWHNFVLAAEDTALLPPRVRHRVTLKAFGAGSRTEFGPQLHGEFSAVRLPKRGQEFYPYQFWKRAFREVRPTSLSTNKP